MKRLIRFLQDSLRPTQRNRLLEEKYLESFSKVNEFIRSGGQVYSDDEINQISKLSLKKQCAELGLPIEQMPRSNGSRPEINAYNALIREGYEVTHCEGKGIGFILKGMCLDSLTKTSCFREYPDMARNDACIKGIGTLAGKGSKELRLIINEIISVRKSKYMHACRELLAHKDTPVFSPSVSIQFADAAFETLSKWQWTRLAEWISLKGEHGNGWPDLTLIRDGELKFAEVKTTDKLHHSQIITISALQKIIDADVRILHVVKMQGD